MKINKISLETSRFIQDTAVNLVPKAVFARSAADLAEVSFLEISESLLVYYGPKLLGEGVFRKLYAPGEKVLSKKSRAAISLSAALIPLTEFSLPYIKNLFTLKMFKQADFNNIANLDKSSEDKKQQEKVKKSAKKHILGAAIAGAAAIGVSQLLLRGKCKGLRDLILAPGDKLFKKESKAANFVNKYFGLNFAEKNGKLALSHGQLTSCVVAGGFGYLGAAKDRGKENFKETLFRYPLVGLYVITGSELFEKGMKKLNKGKPVKPIIPFLFSILVMGLFVSGVSNAFTRYRYKKDQEKNNIQKITFDEFRSALR